jgi:hypothetical protein
VHPYAPRADEFGVLMPMASAKGQKLAPGQSCPKCGKLLAAGACCEEHGNPLEQTPDVYLVSGASTEVEEEELEPEEVEEPVKDDVRLVSGGKYVIKHRDNGYMAVYWQEYGIRRKLVGDYGSLAEVNKAIEQHAAERAADAILRRDGHKEFTKKGLKGEAVTRKSKKG